jgi:predicted MFS family arabinose efflux permease
MNDGDRRNVAIGAGGLAGGVLLGAFGAHSFSYAAVALLADPQAILLAWSRNLRSSLTYESTNEHECFTEIKK